MLHSGRRPIYRMGQPKVTCHLVALLPRRVAAARPVSIASRGPARRAPVSIADFRAARGQQAPVFGVWHSRTRERCFIRNRLSSSDIGSAALPRRPCDVGGRDGRAALEQETADSVRRICASLLPRFEGRIASGQLNLRGLTENLGDRGGRVARANFRGAADERQHARRTSWAARHL